MNEKPKHLLMFKIISLIGLIVFVIGLFLLFTGFGDFDSNNFMIGMFLMPIGLFAGFSGFMIGFRPEMSKMSIKTAKYIQEENKEELKDMTSSSAEIVSDAVTTTVKAVKKGLQETMFCKQCGKEIDVDSKFCRYCGEEQ